MQTDDELIARVKRLPCWRDANALTIAPLTGGLSNRNYRVRDGGDEYVARIGGDMPMHNVMRFNEHACARAAATIGIAPKQVHAEGDAQVVAFIAGATLDADAVRANLTRILAPLRKLHRDGMRALRGPVLAFSMFHVIRCYHQLLVADDCRRGDDLPRLAACAERLSSSVGAGEIALCHNDLLAANFIDDGARIWIIDWEHAGFGAPLFDLANLAANSAFDEELEHAMLSAYHDARVDDSLWRRYKALRAASHLREAMWSMVSEIHSALDEDYAAYTDSNLDDFNRAYATFESL